MTRISRQDVLRYLGIHARQLRAWEKAKLAHPAESYSLEDYGRLRTLRDLNRARFSSASIRASVDAMQNVAGMVNPLLDSRPLRIGSRLLFRQGASVTEPIARQFVFDFDNGSPTGPIPDSNPKIVSPFDPTHADREARVSELFLDAVRLEDAARIDEATALYEQILQLDPTHAPANINLGTICYNRRQFPRAEALYRAATLADPDYALAFFDLGNVLDELRRLPEAIAAYRAAVTLVPAYADAHYNLALAYERSGDRRKALRHWTAYLKLDSASRWASHARNQVRKILDREKLSIVHRNTRLPAHRSTRRNSHPQPKLQTV